MSDERFDNEVAPYACLHQTLLLLTGQQNGNEAHRVGANELSHDSDSNEARTTHAIFEPR